jgi:excisionase family DNA binding protein
VRFLVDGRTVQEAAELLGVNRARVQALISSRKLVAENIDGRWIIADHDLQRYARIPRINGRPLSQTAAWDLLTEFDIGSRALADLPAAQGTLASRALSQTGRILPELSDLTDCPVDHRLGGRASAANHAVSVRASATDIYLCEDNFDSFARWSGFARLTASPNVVVHQVQVSIWQRLASGVPLAAAWLDLADAGDRAAPEAYRALQVRRGR